MASGKQYEMLFKLNAQANAGFKGTFSQAQAEFAKLGNEIQSLNRVQGDLTAYQKQQAAIESTRGKLENLRKQHELLSRQIQEETGSTAGLEREKLKLEQRIAGTQSALENQQGRLSATSRRLKDAGVNTGNLAGESARLSGEIKKLSAEQEKAGEAAQKHGELAVNAFEAAGGALAAAGIVTVMKEIGAAYLECVQAAGEFGAAMSNVEALSGASRQEMGQLTAQAKELGATTKFTALESGAAYGYMGMAGWNAQEMLLGMPGVLDLAAASEEDLAEVSDIVTDALTGFKLQASNTGEFVDVLAMAATKSNTKVSLLGESFKYAAPLCGTLGYSAQDTAIFLGLMANAGIKGSQAGTTLKTSLANLSAPTKAQAAEIERLGISLTDANGQMLPLLDLTRNMREAFSGMSEAEQTAAASTIFGKEAMSGMLAVINASEADFRSLTSSIYNSAGAAKEMAEIKLDNLKGDLTLLDSAVDGLGLTIGEAFMPQIRELVQAGTGVISFLNQVVEEHPVLTKSILAAAGAVGAVTAAVTAFAAAKKAAAFLDLASMFTSPVGAVLALTGAVVGLGVGIAGAIEEANKGKPDIEELTEAAREAAGAMEEIAGDFEASRVDILATADMAGLYIDRLDQLEAQTGRTAAESQEYHNILQLLCDTIPELGEQIDLENDRIEGGTEALWEQTEAWKENAEAQARQQAYQELTAQHGAVLKEQAKNSILLTDAQLRYNRAEAEHAEIVKQMEAMENDTALYDPERYYELGQQLGPLTTEMFEAAGQMRGFQEALDISTAAAEESKAEMEGYGQALAELSGSAEDAAGGVEGLAGAVRDIGPELEAVMGGAVEKATELAEAYQSAYDAAFSSIQGQYALWDEAAEVVAVSAGTINAGLESQVSYWQDYNANLEALRGRSAEIEGLEAVIASFADGSTESVNAVAGMASATDEELAAMVQSWQSLQKEQDAAADKISELKTHYTEEMDKLLQELEADIDAMDLGPEAYEQGKATIQGYLNGLEEAGESAIAEASRIADGVLSQLARISNASVGVPMGYRDIGGTGRHYAAGTSNAERGFALVGEDGPEVVFFQGGEQVMNARETAALQRNSALRASPVSGGSGREPMVVQIYFQIEGHAVPEAVESLREYGEEFEDRVRRVMEDYVRDSARGRYI